MLRPTDHSSLITMFLCARGVTGPKFLYKKHDHGAYTSGFAHGQKAIEEEFSLSLIKQKYVTNYIRIEGEADLNYGKIKNKNIGYIFLRQEKGNDPAKAIERIINELDDHKAIVFDIRTNDGGGKRYAKIIAGGFSDGEHLITTSQTRNGPHHDDFNGKVNEITLKTGAEQFLKPVILLTDRTTMSAGEYLTLYMRSFNHVTQIGDTTAGDFSAVGIRRFLPNGMTYQYSIQMLQLPDRSSLDGIGIAPDIYIKNNKADISAQHDRVLEGAIEYLFNEYGIE